MFDISPQSIKVTATGIDPFVLQAKVLALQDKAQRAILRKCPNLNMHRGI